MAIVHVSISIHVFGRAALYAVILSTMMGTVLGVLAIRIFVRGLVCERVGLGSIGSAFPSVFRYECYLHVCEDFAIL